MPWDPRENLAIVCQKMSTLYGELGSENRFSGLKWTMFDQRYKSQPKLRGKAAEVRDFIPVLLEICKEFFNFGVTVHRMIISILEGWEIENWEIYWGGARMGGLSEHLL